MIEGALQFVVNGVLSALPFLFVLTVVVFIHELGHFLVARWCGVTVKAFSIGFGPEIFGFYDRYGTRWRVAWVPLGGYVKFLDDETSASTPSRDALERMSPAERAGSFHGKTLWQRAAVVAAGPMANFLLAIVIFAAWFLIYGVHSTEARIDGVVPGSPADRAGFQQGDLVLEISGKKIGGFEDVQKIITTNVGRDLDVLVSRGEQTLQLKVTPELREQADESGQKVTSVVIGIKRTTTPDSIKTYQPGLGEAVVLAVKQTSFIITSTLGYIGDIFGGRQNADQLGGPIRIADIANKAAKQGLEYVVNLVAWISVSVGLLNLFPIPLLDGGHLMFYALEAIRRKPLSEKAQEIGFRIGMAFVLSLMIFATINDLPTLKSWFPGG